MVVPSPRRPSSRCWIKGTVAAAGAAAHGSAAKDQGGLTTPSPPAEKTTARQDQARQSRANDGSGDCQESPKSRRLGTLYCNSPACSALDIRLDAAMIFPVNKIPISTVIEGRGAQRHGSVGAASKNRPISRIAPSYRRKQEVDVLTSTKNGVPERDGNPSSRCA